VLDDGFQHRRLHRDLDIVLYTPAEKIAFREPVSSLKRANILLMKKGVDPQRKKRIRERFPESTVFEYSVKNKGFFKLVEKGREPGEKLKRKKVLAFCGIARPERFLSILHEEGIKPSFFFKFPDHHPYPKSSLEKITEKYKKINAEAIITTEKDALKIIHNNSFKKIPAYYLKIDLEVEDKFYARISNLLQNWV
jgi:tetraacyldisaccharide 4'-kinase